MEARPVHSLHIIGSKKLGGAESFFIRLVTSLTNAGHPVDVICRPNSGVFNALKDTPVTVHPVSLRSVFCPFSRHQIQQIIKTIKPDVVQTYMGRATRLTRIPKGSSCKLIARLGGYYKLNGYQHADCWVANTQQIRQYLIDHRLPPSRCHYIPNFVGQQQRTGEKVAPPEAMQQLAANDLVILGLGRQVPKKGFDSLINAFASLPETINGKTLKLVLLGDGKGRQALVDQVANLGLEQRLLMPGWQTNIWPWFQRAELFVCPSRHEPLGNVILEAWAAGKAVISTANDGANELIEHDKTGLIVSLDNTAHELQQALLELLQDPDKRQQLATAGYQQIEHEFSESSVREQYLQLYRACIDQV
ncbi:glycosyltransferase [Neiella sp. HB171785]|uniref:Glycosyltransferase n=1 Tax=Neiella litorisoli TaxID=2771431 RepID=A0A8J6QJ91_9GAMM|nr:glycosyltransferase [Neiella litorisoli]MBD1391355.1 glycosyltransferase [Neiella litorisoli]